MVMKWGITVRHAGHSRCGVVTSLPVYCPLGDHLLQILPDLIDHGIHGVFSGLDRFRITANPDIGRSPHKVWLIVGGWERKGIAHGGNVLEAAVTRWLAASDILVSVDKVQIRTLGVIDHEKLGVNPRFARTGTEKTQADAVTRDSIHLSQCVTALLHVWRLAWEHPADHTV